MWDVFYIKCRLFSFLPHHSKESTLSQSVTSSIRSNGLTASSWEKLKSLSFHNVNEIFNEASRHKVTKRTFQIEFLIDDSKAEIIANIVFSEFEKQKEQSRDSPSQNLLPTNISKGSREHALFLTYVMSINYMSDSTQLWKKARAAYMLFPERFLPDRILKSKPQTLESFVRYLGARQYAIGAKTWSKISKVLLDSYEGDPRNIAKGPLRIQDIQNRLKRFPYLRGSKLSKQYIRAMGQAGLFDVKNLNQLNIPVDKQVARFTICTGTLKLASKRFTGYLDEDPIKDLLESVWRNAVKGHGSSAPWMLHEPICLIESTLCSSRKCKQCPIESSCEKRRRGLTLKENVVFWSNSR